MAFIVRETWRGCVARVQRHGRCGALDLAHTHGHFDHERLRIRIVGIHAPHDDEELEDTFSAVASLVRSATFPSARVCAGDWNVDQSSHDAGRARRRSHRREMLQSLADAVKCRILLPTACSPVPGVDVQPQSPRTRRPVGLRAGMDHLSLLDYAVADEQLVSEVACTWQGAPADHAFIRVTMLLGGRPRSGDLPIGSRLRARRRTAWPPTTSPATSRAS